MNTLKLAVITSFTVSGLRESAAHWPEGVRFAELYCFMQPDVKEFLAPFSGLDPDDSAIKHMARLKQLSDHSSRPVDQLAAKISALFRERGVKIVALATFLPEITCEEAGRAGLARESLMFLLRLAHALNRKERHAVSAVEMVAGGLLGGIERAGRPAYKAAIRNRSETLGRLCENLSPVVEECGSEPMRICLAIELEPGPLYVLGNWKAVKQLNALLDSAEFAHLSPCVGFNLDIPHWAILSRINPNHVRQAGILRRLVHAHLSDHDKGHFCDNVLHFENSRRKAHDARLFRPWIRLLEARSRHEPHPCLPRFSNVVSYELEACKNPEMLQQAIRRASALLGQGPTQPPASKAGASLPKPRRPTPPQKKLSGS